MSLTNPYALVNEERLAEFYQTISPYLGGMPDILANKFAKGDMHSTDEKMIGQWIDGKPLYQKVVDFGALPNNTTKNVAHGIANIGFIAGLKGVAKHTNNTYISIPNPATSNILAITINDTNISITTNGNYSNYTTSYITLQYTKTTDSAVYIGDDTDYSTTEKIVGTWIDGKPIYQKTVQFNANYSTSGSGIKYIQFDTEIMADVIASQEGYFTLDGKKISIGSSEFNWSGGNSFMSYVMVKSNGHVYLYISHTNDYPDTSAQGYVTVQYTKSS